MKLTFLGAAHEVTGSCTLLETAGKRILIDCGMEQGEDIFVNQTLPVQASKLDFVLLTHAHIDHILYAYDLAKKCGLQVTTIPAPSPKKLLLKNYAREFICFAEFLK